MPQSFRRSGWSMAFLVMLTALAPPLNAQVAVRGRIERRTSDGTYPAVGVVVLLRAKSGASSDPIYTNQGGMYYVGRVPPGDYVLEVRLSEQSDPIVTRQVRIPAPTHGATVFDIPPISISL